MISHRVSGMIVDACTCLISFLCFSSMAPASIPVVVNLGEITNNTLHGSIEILLNHTLWKQLLASHPTSNTSLLVNTKQSQSPMDLQNTEGDNIPPYDGRGAGMYACLVIAFYAFSIIMFIATIVKRKVC